MNTNTDLTKNLLWNHLKNVYDFANIGQQFILNNYDDLNFSSTKTKKQILQLEKWFTQIQ